MAQKYDWKFSTIGGITRVSIESGEDIAHLGELDKKLWTVLSLPIESVEFCKETLSLIDSDGDGKIRVKEMVEASNWVCSMLKDRDLLLQQSSVLPLDAINQESVEGKRLYESAKQILANLGIKSDEIKLENTADSKAIFANTQFNGDGVITSSTSDNADDKAAIEACIKCLGAAQDRSGKDGINAEMVEKFYAALAAYQAWMNASEQDAEGIFPMGEQTQAAYDCCMRLDSKMKDYFMRCKLSRYNEQTSSLLDVQTSQISDITGKDLSQCYNEIANYPLAGIAPDAKLHLVMANPAWGSELNALKRLVLEPLKMDAETVSEEQWNTILATFSKFTAWKGAKAGTEVEAIGLESVRQLLEQNRKEELLKLINKDLELKDEAESIDHVHKLLLYNRDIYKLIKNFVTFQDFYSHQDTETALFMAGKLYIEQRSCGLCIKVTDMGKQGAMASASGMYLLYCECSKKNSAEKFNIVAVVTEGDINDLRVGANGIFYDRAGMDWDATVTKIVDNPISLKQGFWQPYRKFGQFVENQINKIATNMDDKVTQDATGKIAEVSTKVESTNVTAQAPADAATTKKAQAFDIAKFCGIFAAIGMALGYIGSFLTSVVSGFMALDWWQMILVIPGILLIISLPSMVIAWLKIRKRSLSPILTANGWAINSQAKVNISFGSTLTHIAKVPMLNIKSVSDPFSDKKPLSKGKKWFIWTLVILAAVATAVWYFNRDEVSSSSQLDEPAPMEEPATLEE